MSNHLAALLVAGACGAIGCYYADHDWRLLTTIGSGCGGAFLGYFIWGIVHARKGVKLSQNFRDLGNLSDLHIDEIVEKVGNYTSVTKVKITDRNNAIGYLYTWQEINYSITLLFDEYKFCICINEEKEL